MKVLTAFVLLLMLCRYSTGKLYTVENCGKSLAAVGRIVKGTPTKPGAYPWMVSIHQLIDDNKWIHMCGGSILNANWIVTAAHCFDQPVNESEYQVYVGLYSKRRKDDPTVQLLKLSKIILHDKYVEDGYDNDIALLKTATPIDFKKSRGYVNGICLPPGLTNPNGNATVIGWGRLSEDGPVPAELQEVTVPIIPWQECKNIYANSSEYNAMRVVPAMICAGGNGKDACEYDSGGPLFQVDKEGVATLIGTVANGAGCGYKHYPSTYMKVSAFKTWMNKTMD